ncbi:DNA starvation/stationary phase protection protein [Candidatus Sulfidibacterium hydrothermale]|uniref:Dps family protein n=1 Tax=Candidatus Sulfidibacterium hydrothermale TaxID=2875962 RepID=UPI001F0AAA49|nr:Dps family protein [Candidatus Sulfidibacterium hydrothermale]UBM62586.1 DNA starvation/stationary phase protection protein [Candidatus Sulfidibacterium hydrothermale]
MNNIGINKEKAQMLAERLQELLADYQIFYTNVRGFHWNIRGEKFFELHLKFEELYNDLILKIDEVAERILTLGFAPEYRYSRYISSSQIQETEQTANGTQNVKNLIDSFSVLITKQRELLQLSAEADDEGTNSLMSDYIREQEKLVWMYSAFLNRN